MSAPTERMSRVDNAWLRMDNEVNLMMVVAVWLMTPAVTREAIAARVADKLMKYGRFRQRVFEDALGASWVEDESFDVDHHVVAHRLAPHPGQGERAALQELVGRLATTPLDPTRPLWQFHLVEDYEGGSAMPSAMQW